MNRKSISGFQLTLESFLGIRCKPSQNQALRRSVPLLCSDVGGQQLPFLMRRPSFDGLKRLSLQQSMAQPCRISGRIVSPSVMVHYGASTR